MEVLIGSWSRTLQTLWVGAWNQYHRHGAQCVRSDTWIESSTDICMHEVVHKEDDQRLAFFEQDAKSAELALDSMYFDEVVDPAPGDQWGKFYFPTYIDTPVVGATIWRSVLVLLRLGAKFHPYF